MFDMVTPPHHLQSGRAIPVVAGIAGRSSHPAETKSSLLRGESERALREVVAYRLYVDRSVTGRSRCLEQAGLLVIGSANLDAVGADEEEWPAPRWPRPRPAGLGRPVRPWPAGRRSGANGAISAQLVADQPSQRGR